jgi:hypothetical protein
VCVRVCRCLNVIPRAFVAADADTTFDKLIPLSCYSRVVDAVAAGCGGNGSNNCYLVVVVFMS